MRFAMVYITHADETAAQRLCAHLLEQRLIACANIFPIISAYWWQGAIQNDGEWVSIVKTTLEKWDTLKDVVAQLHPYQTPCIIKIEVESNAAYEQWIHDSVQKV